MGEYLRRVVDDDLDFYLDTFGAVLLHGPKWCGKTATAEMKAKSMIKLQDPRKIDQYKKAAGVSISNILDGEHPRLIDEWQVMPEIWDAVRSEADEFSETGMFLLTGSRVPPKEPTHHSGAGRIGVLDMYPMSLFESGDSNGRISLKSLFEGTCDMGAESSLTVEQLAYCLCRGGWPSNVRVDYRKCVANIRCHLGRIYESDDLPLKKYAKDPELAKAVVRSYSRNISSSATNKAMLADIRKGGISVSESRYYDYISALKDAHLIKDLDAWSPATRSKGAVCSSPKRELIDPSIAALYLGFTPSKCKNDFDTFGLLFESLCIRDLRVYSSTIHGKVSYYHDRYGLEVDAVVSLDDGRFGLIEIKLGSGDIDDGAKNLLKLESALEDANLPKPVFKMVLTGAKLSYVRRDGVLVVPIGCLGP